MRLRESEMTEPISHWLKARGFQVWTEIPCLYRSVDIVGYDGETLVGIEMKTGFCMMGVRQAQSVSVAFDQVWLAVGARPRAITREKCDRYRIGLLWVNQRRGICKPMVEPNGKAPLTTWRQKLIATLQMTEPGGIGGKPCLAGEGPAQQCEERISRYREEHPHAKWPELYREIPNHYASVASMRGAMYMLRQRRAWKRRRDI